MSTNSGQVQLLTDEIRAKTKGLHNKMDRIVQLGLFAALDYKIYRQILLGFYYVFITFEEEYQTHVQKSPPNLWLLATYSPELRRREALEADLKYFYGPDWKNNVQPTEQVKEYMEHIREISKEKPEKLIAYPATLYLGIFFGGQIARSKIIKSTNFFPSPPNKTLGGVNDNGIALFTFRERISNPGDAYGTNLGKKLDPNAVKNILKARLNTIPGFNEDSKEAAEAREAIIVEAKEIFVRNMDLMTSAEGVWGVWIRWIFQLILYAAIGIAALQYFQLQFQGKDAPDNSHEL
ncbi:heme oxygenase [Entomortierella beljakovae]|nr:heme oxygenase [Entomortierella beljakovae]